MKFKLDKKKFLESLAYLQEFESYDIRECDLSEFFDHIPKYEKYLNNRNFVLLNWDGIKTQK